MDAAELATMRNTVIEAKESAEVEYSKCRQVLERVHPEKASFGNLLAQEQTAQGIPPVSILSLTSTNAWSQNISLLAGERFSPEGVAMAYTKDFELFSYAHDILQIMFR